MNQRSNQVEKNSEDSFDASRSGLQILEKDFTTRKIFIKSVYLQDNLLTELPEDFFEELPNLSYCDLRNNRIKWLPALKEEHDELKTLLLQGNLISTLTYTLANAVALKTLGLSGNPIVDPPAEIIATGCSGILQYLSEKLMAKVELKDSSNPVIPVYSPRSKRLEDAQNINSIASSQKNTSRQSAQLERYAPPRSIGATSSIKSSVDIERKELAKKKYSWELWRDIPYEGRSHETLLQNAINLAKKETERKFNQEIGKMLQRIKDKDALKQWRDATRRMQLKSRSCRIERTVDPPFGTEKNAFRSSMPRLTPDQFQRELTGCLLKLREFSAKPANLNDTSEALGRIQEAVSVQKKLSSLKMIHPFVY